MGSQFEVKETDLLGRVGVLKAGGRSLETPCLLPVVHPVSQAVPLTTIASLGFRGVMTNSFIIAARRRAEAVRDGVHRMLGFDGVVMTDSGGYQVLEYGSMGLDYRQVAELQRDIGSDFAVTLDRPTGYPQSRKVALETVEYSLRNALATRREFPGGDTNWMGPVQGGLHLPLVRKSARDLVRGGFDYLALGSPVQVMENYMFSDLVRMILAARSSIPYSVPLHLFGAGHPLTMALAVALGCDTFDSASYIIFARSGRYMRRNGISALASLEYLPCSCPVCSGTSVKELQELDFRERTRRLALHNLYVLREELEACKEAVAEGRLWDLVEEKSMAHPRMREAFLELARNSPMLAEGTPAVKDRGLFVRGPEDLLRPEVVSAKRRAAGAARRRMNEALVVSNSARVRRRQPPGRDVYRYSPVLGTYPTELDTIYPFGQVTAAGDHARTVVPEEARIELKKLGYARVSTPGGSPRIRSRRSRRGASPCLPSSSARPRSPRRP